MQQKQIDSEKDLELLKKINQARTVIETELSQIIVGQKRVIEEMLIALFARGHCEVVGVPGLAKTLLVSSLSAILDLDFKRVQFTPDLMPADITGTEIIQEDAKSHERHYKFIPGPIFANMVLADEINRTPPKTQAALLEAMQEFQVTVGGKNYELPLPFFVLATQNPIEQEGTYPLPEAQLDRFFFQINIHYPTLEEEIQIVEQTTSGKSTTLHKVLTAQEVLEIQKLVRRVPIAPHLIQKAVNIVRATRPTEPNAFSFVRNWVQWGAGPRASQTLVLAAKARALLSGRTVVNAEDIHAVAYPALRHRIILSFHAQAESIRADTCIKKILDELEEKNS